MAARFETYAIMPEESDGLPAKIRNGFRIVEAKINPKTVSIRYGDNTFRIPRQKWDMRIPSVRVADTNGSLRCILVGLQNWNPSVTLRPIRRRRKR